MQIDDIIRGCVVFLGRPVGDQFLVSGTAFMVNVTVEDCDFRYVISARHILWPRPMGFNPAPPDSEIYLRINRKNGKPPKEILTKISEWIFHDQFKVVDICAYRFSLDKHDVDDELDLNELNIPSMCLARSVDDFAPYFNSAPVVHEIELGDEIFIAGAFISHVGRKRNIPIIRIGNITAMPEEPVEFFSPTRPAYLIDMRSIGGLSGSPVFLHLNPNAIRGSAAAKAWGFGPVATMSQEGVTRVTRVVPYNLIGMLLGNPGSDEYIKDIAPRRRGKRAKEDINSGISVVLPVGELLHFLYLPKFREERDNITQERKRIVG